MSTRTTPRFVLPDTSALDDVTVEDDVLTSAYTSAVARALVTAEREDRSRAKVAAKVAAKRDAQARYEQHDRWHGDVAEVHAFLTAHPAF